VLLFTYLHHHGISRCKRRSQLVYQHQLAIEVRRRYIVTETISIYHWSIPRNDSALHKSALNTSSKTKKGNWIRTTTPQGSCLVYAIFFSLVLQDDHEHSVTVAEADSTHFDGFSVYFISPAGEVSQDAYATPYLKLPGSDERFA
jgi:hypothetical protein